MTYILRIREPVGYDVQMIEVPDEKVHAIMELVAEKKTWHNIDGDGNFYNLAYFVDCKKKIVPPSLLQSGRFKELPEPVRKENLEKFRAMKKKLFGKKEE